MMLNAQSKYDISPEGICGSNLYCLVYGQMSHWGELIASNVIIYIFFYDEIYFIIKDYNTLYFKPSSGGHFIEKKCVKRSDVTNFNQPLNKEILEIIYGSLLGDASAEKRKGGKGTRILFYQEGTHTEYLLYLHRLIANLGYCNTNLPKLQTRLGKNGKIRKIIRFSTWTYDQFNEIYNNWYINNKKILPNNIDYYLSPLALAIWIMDDGGKVSKGLKLATNNFTLNEIKHLIFILDYKYNIKSTIHKTGTIDQYNIYILSSSMPTLVNIVKPYIVPSMKYKLLPYL